MLILNSKVNDYSALLAKLAELEALPMTRMRKALEGWKLPFTDHINTSLSGVTLNKRTGEFFKKADPRQNITIVEIDDHTFSVQLKGNVVVYAHAQEFGATITPKNKQWLTIPLTGSYSGAHPKPLTAYPKSEKFFIRSKTDPADLVAYWKEAGKKAVPIFVLKKKVVLKSRPWFKESVENAIPHFFERLRET